MTGEISVKLKQFNISCLLINFDPVTKALAEPLSICGVKMIQKSVVALNKNEHQHKLNVEIILQGCQKDITAMKNHLNTAFMD